jgi:dTDP-4-amino-4,6-dideoxygalactose transaminase
VERRRELVARYAAALEGLSGAVTLLLDRPGRRSSYHLLVAQVAGVPARRRRAFDELPARNIRCQVHYIPVHLQPWYRQHFGTHEGQFPHAEAYYSGCLSLPLFPAMADADVDRVCSALREILCEN